MRFNPRSNMSSRAALPAAGHGKAKNTEHHPDQHPPRFEVCGEPRGYNLARPWQRPQPLRSGTVPVRQRGDAHPDPSPEGSQDTRSRSAAEFSGPCQQQPERAGYGYPKLYRTDPFAISKWRQPRAGRCSLSSEHRSRNGFTGVPLTGKVPVSPESGRCTGTTYLRKTG